MSDHTQGEQVLPALLNACIALLNQAGIAQREAPMAAVSINVEGTRVEIVANSKGQVLWLRSEAGDLSHLLQAEQLIKREVKNIIKVTFN